MIKELVLIIYVCIFWAQETSSSLHNHQMHRAAQIGDMQIIRESNLTDQTGINWAIECAAANGQTDVLRALISSKMHSLYPDQYGINISLMRAASYGDIEIVKYLTQHSTKQIPLPDQIGINWAISESSRAGNFEIVKYLLEHQFENIPYPDQKGINDAATHAALEGHLQIFHFLSSHQFKDIPYPDEDTIKELKEEHAHENEFVEILLEFLEENNNIFTSRFEEV